MNSHLWHYDMLKQFNEQYYKEVMLPTCLTGEEIAMGKEDNKSFFYIAKKNKQLYLIPSGIIENGEIPFKITGFSKIGYKGKAFLKVNSILDVSIKAENLMSYKQMIDFWMDYKHKEKERFTLWKIIVEAASSRRINVRVITYPCWMKDSPVITLAQLKGDCFSVNKPSIAKMKYLLNESTSILALNEIQKIDTQEKSDLSHFYEDIGDFKPDYTNPTRATSGSSEQCSVSNLSTLTFSNFPKDGLLFEEKEKEKFESIFDPKISGRIFPILFVGGTEKEPACEERFGNVTNNITLPEINELRDWLRTFKYYEINGTNIANSKGFKCNYAIPNTRWDRNFQTIAERIALYSETQLDFDKWIKLLYDCHKEYLDYLGQKEESEQQKIIEESIVEFDVNKIEIAKCCVAGCDKVDCNIGADGKPYCRKHYEG